MQTIAVSLLRPDWLATTGSTCSMVRQQSGRVGSAYLQSGLRCPLCCTWTPPPHLQTGYGAEGPVVFKHDNRHYIFASHLTGECWLATASPHLHKAFMRST